MKRFFRIFLNLTLALSLVFSSSAAFAFSADSKTSPASLKEDIEKEVRNQYLNDPQFIMDIQENGQAHGEEMLQRIIESKYKKMLNISSDIGLHGGNGTLFYVPDLKNIQQIETWSCGAASTLQALYGFGVEGDVTGSTDEEKEYTIIDDAEANGAGLIVYKVRNVLNKYTDAGYIYEKGKDMDLEEFGYNLAYSMMWDLAPLLHAMTGELEYYGGKDLGHYLTVSFISWSRNKTIEDAIVTLNDPHYDDNYFGNHDVPLSEAFNTVNLSNKDRYVIYVPL